MKAISFTPGATAGLPALRSLPGAPTSIVASKLPADASLSVDRRAMRLTCAFTVSSSSPTGTANPAGSASNGTLLLLSPFGVLRRLKNGRTVRRALRQFTFRE